LLSLVVLLKPMRMLMMPMLMMPTLMMMKSLMLMKSLVPVTLLLLMMLLRILPLQFFLVALGVDLRIHVRWGWAVARSWGGAARCRLT
jgi:hypothetical protein